MKIIRRLKELDGLENGLGLKITLSGDLFVVVYKESNDIIRNLKVSKSCLPIIKAMGFNFEYKPLRSLEEVFDEMKMNSFNAFKKYSFPVYGICGSAYCRSYSVVAEPMYGVVTFVFNLETAEKYVKELNEILEGINDV